MKTIAENQTLKNFQQQINNSTQSNVAKSSESLTLGLSQNQSTEQECSSTPQAKGLSDEKLLWLWLSMSALYPQKWNAAMGEVFDNKGDMTVQARVWKRGLNGITGKQIANAIDSLTDNYTPFIPDLGEFKKLCLVSNDLPTLDRCVMVLSHIQQRKGTVAELFEHPLILAINAHSLFDFHLFMQMDVKAAKSHLKPIYDDLAANGFPEFLPEHFENQIAIERILTEEEKAEVEAEKQRKAEAAAEARKQLFSFGKVLVDDEPVNKPAIDTNECLRREQSAEPTPEQIAERAARKAVLQAQAKMLMEKVEQEELANA